MNVLVEKTEIV